MLSSMAAMQMTDMRVDVSKTAIRIAWFQQMIAAIEFFISVSLHQTTVLVVRVGV